MIELGRPLLAVALISLASSSCADAGPEPRGGTSSAALEKVDAFGSNPGGLVMYRHVPPSASKNAPLVVALHGCTQHASDYERVGWNALADTYGFYVVYAEQTSANNPVQCFDWWGQYNHPDVKDNITRGKGEDASIAQMVDKMKSDFSIDAKRVFVTGVSGGGAMAVVMLSTYPDVFAGGAVFAGIPYDCPSTTNADVWSCIKPGKVLDGKNWGDRVRAGFPGYSGARPRIAIWQGTKDSIVDTTNQTELVEQWTNVHGLDATKPSASDTIDGYPRTRWNAADGTPLVEEWQVTGMDHGVPVDPSHGCGTAGAYVLDAKICSALHAARFFGIASSSPPPPPPPTDAGVVDSGVADSGPHDVGVDSGSISDASVSGSFVETFSKGGGPDEPGWNLGAFVLDPSDHTGTFGSRSIHAHLVSALDVKTTTASITVHLGASPRLSYARRLSLSSANIASTARFQVVVTCAGASSAIDDQAQKLGSYADKAWSVRGGIDLSGWAGRDVTLSFVVTLVDPWSFVSSAEAWVDDIRVD